MAWTRLSLNHHTELMPLSYCWLSSLGNMGRTKTDAMMLMNAFDGLEGGRQKSWVGGRKYAIDFRLYSIRQLFIFKASDQS